MKKITKTVVSMLSALTVCSGVVGTTVLALPTPETTVKAATTPTTASSVLRYDESLFTVTEDQSAYVTPSVYTTTDANAKKNGKYASKLVLLDDNQTDAYAQRIQLDEGKSGLLVQTKKAGSAANGSTFSFASTMKDDFSLDFRVFSEHTFQGNTSVGGQNGYWWAPTDKNSSFLDLRRVVITFTSKTDSSKAFSVYIAGGEGGDNTTTQARVAVSGEDYRMHSIPGYSATNLYYNDMGHGDWSGSGVGNGSSGHCGGEELHGTSFVNASKWQLETYSNTIEFDLDTMSVYTVEKTLTYDDSMAHSYGGNYQEQKVLLRDLTNNLTANGNKFKGNTAAYGYDKNNPDNPLANALKPLYKSDFEGGYTVSVEFDEVTDTSVPVQMTTDGGSTYTTVDSSPDRIAKMLIYSVNGQSLRQYEDWTVTEDTLTYAKDGNTLYANQQAKVYTYTSKATGTQAEGNAVALSSEQVSKFTDSNGVFNLSYGTAWVQRETGDESSGTYYTLYGNQNSQNAYRGYGERVIERDAFSDVRTMGVTVRSKTDPSKAFTLYTDSQGNKDSNSKMLSRVAVEGEGYRNGENRPGFGYADGGNTNVRVWNNTITNGTFGSINNAVADGSDADPYVKMRFNPIDMTVQVRSGEKWWTVRDLDASSQGQPQNVATLSANDFAGGYTVEIELVHMNTNDNNGLSMLSSLKKGDGTLANSTIYSGKTAQCAQKENAYNRPGVIKVVEYKENDGYQQNLGDFSATLSEVGYPVTWSYDTVSVQAENVDYVAGGVNVGLTVNETTLFGTAAKANAPVNMSWVCDEDATVNGTVTTTDANGVAGFKAVRPGTYTMNYNGTTYKTNVSGEKFYVYYDADVTDGEDNYKTYYIGYETTVNFADLAPTGLAAGETFIGYTVEGQEGIYAPDYVYTIPTTFESGAQKSIRITPVIVDFAAASGASVRIATDGTSGLRFRAYLSKSVYEALGNDVSFSVAMAMEGGAYGALKAIDAANIYEENRNGKDIYSMTAALYNIEEVGMGVTQNFKAKFGLSVTYVGESEATTFEVETELRNLKSVAVALQAEAEYATLSEAQKAIVDKYAGA